MPSTLVRRSATGSEKARTIETWPAIWQTASSPRANAGSTSSGRVTSPRRYQAPAGTFSRRPLNSLSTTDTACPSARRRRHRWEPMNPAPPVTRILIPHTPPARERASPRKSVPPGAEKTEWSATHGNAHACNVRNAEAFRSRTACGSAAFASILPHQCFAAAILASRHLVNAIVVLSTAPADKGDACLRTPGMPGAEDERGRIRRWAFFRQGDAYQEDTDYGWGRVYRQQCGTLLRSAELERDGPRQSFQSRDGQESAVAARRHDLRFRARRRARPAEGGSRPCRKTGSMRCYILPPRWPSQRPWPTRAPILPSTRSAHSMCSTPSGCHCPEAVFIFASTNKVYGKIAAAACELRGSRYAYVDRPYGIGETEALDFLSPYGCSKGAADQYALDFARIYQIPATSFRQSCIYGPRQFGVEDQGWVAWFAIASMLGRDITIFGDGKQVRDVLHVDDLAARLRGGNPCPR